MKKYVFKYGSDEAKIVFLVDEKLFTEESAKTLLDFYSWDYDYYENPIDELLIKYSLEIIKLTSYYNYLNINGIIKEFEKIEGFIALDGTSGVKLIELDGFEFNENYLEFDKYITTEKI
jgi:hypothetical protein